MAGGSGGVASGRLVVLDRAGHAVKAFPLASGAATIGRAPSCDIRILLQAVEPHHASLLVHRNQVLIRDEGTGETLVNGGVVSVAALQHGDVISMGGKQMRWEYDAPRAARPAATRPALYKPLRAPRPARRVTTAGAARDVTLVRRALLDHRASMPGNAGGKQVAIVQPQRRDTSEQIDTQARSVSNSPRSQNRSRSRLELDSSPHTPPSRASFNKCPPDTTVATLWIESRKTASPSETRKASPRKTIESRKSSPKKSASPRKTPRKSLLAKDVRKSSRASSEAASGAAESISSRKSSRSASTPARLPLPRAVSAKKSTPLRVAVLRRAKSAHKARVTKIEAPREVDHMKQAALLLMAGRSPRVSLASLGAHKRSPIHAGEPRTTSLRNSRGSARSSTRSTVSLVEITDTSVRDSSAHSASSPRSGATPARSPLLPSPKKSSLKDPKRSSRKTESIKFDLSNLESYSSQDEDDYMETGRSSVRESTRNTSSRMSKQNARRNSGRSTRSTYADATEDDLTLHYTDTSRSPSPRRPIHSRTNTILELSGSPLRASERKTLTPPESPSARKSLRGSIIVQKALENTKDETRNSRRSTKTLTENSFDATAESAFRTRTMSPRSARNLESYSIVDLVSSRDSNDSNSTKSASVYDSAGSTRTSSIMFGTPRAGGYSTRSTLEANALSSSTPYVGRGRASTRSQSSPNIRKSSPNKSTRSSAARRSKSLTTPENSEETQKHISINSTKISRASKSRSRLNDSDLQLITFNIGDGEDSPRTSRRNTTANLSHAISSLSPNKKTSPSLLARTSSPIISSPKRASTRTSSPKISNSRVSNLKQTSPRRSNSKQSTPKSSPKRASQTFSPKTNAQTKRGSRSLNSDVTYVSSEDEGTVTPENLITLQEQGTPMLSIQTLLNSSQNSFASKKSQKSQKSPTSRNSQRKTIGIIRSDTKGKRNSAKSKSFTASTRRSLRALRLNSRESDRINESILSNDEENVTPKTGGVKLVQEAVKNKHSTAKKPQSKRSIIDNLNDSDIVKQLFNSPVKRKLSQSMTEFSRKKLFDDEEVRRPTRNTMFVRTPDQSIMDNTDRYTPDNFVSPLSTPGNSPNLTGIKRLYTRSTPRNDLTNVKGVKGLLRSPRTRKSDKNDLSNVSGVKNLLRTRKSVRNDLTNVSGVKDVFAASPANDLRRVSGVKSLFKRQKEKASPRNDLSDVRGVKTLFTKRSPTNDLRNVSGVKKTLAKSPKNDLRDVRGVKQMLRQNRSRKDDSYDLSGVEELFNVSNVSSTSNRNSEALFDQLIGKPPIKAVYSKSFLTKRPQRGKISRRARSLRNSIELITNNVEVWLEKELNKHLHKDQSTDKVSRALQQLATDTVQGSEPIQTSRIRNSTLNKTQLNATAKKSASEIYEAHMLPIKKRSVSRTSFNKSGNKSVAKAAAESLNKSGAKVVKLPIKKRVVHSTPVKGRANLTLTMNASELGRVSPIALERTVAQEITNINRSKQTKASPKGRGKQVSKVTIILEPIHIIEEPTKPKSPPKKATKAQTNENSKSVNLTKSPRPTRGARSKATEEPAAKRPARGGSKTAEVKSPVKKTRTTKASVTAVAEPETKAKRGRGKTTNESLPNTRRGKQVAESPKAKGKRGAKAVVAEKNKPGAKTSPKRTRGRQTETAEVPNTKRRRQSLVITKKAPVMSPKATITRKVSETKPESPKTSRSTRQKVVEKPKTPLKTRAKLVIAKPSPKLNPSSTRRGRKQPQTPEKPQPPSPKKPRKATKEIPKSPEKKPSPPKRGRSAANKSLDVEPPAKRGRSAKNVTIKSPKKTRGKAEVTAAPARSNRRTKSETEAVSVETNRRKRKSDETSTNPVPAKVAKTTRGRKGAESLVITISPKGKRTVSPVKEKATRGKKQNTTQKDESLPQASRSTRRAGKADTTKQSPAKKRKQYSPKESPAKKAKPSPAKKPVKAKASPVKKTKASPAKKVISSPAKNITKSPAKKAKASPAKKGKAAPAKKVSPVKAKQSPVKKAQKAKASPAKKAKVSPVKKASPAKKTKPSPVKKTSNTKSAKGSAKVNESPVKKTRGGKKVVFASPPSKRKPAVAASPAKAAPSTRSRRR